MSAVLYALRRSIEIGKKEPGKLRKLFGPEGWRSLLDLVNEGKVELGKAAMSPQEKRELRQNRRRRQFAAAHWIHGQDTSLRKYESYEQYLEHQKAKLPFIEHRLRENAAERTEGFRKRFELLDVLPKKSTVVCLGARLGHEVAAFLSLGHFAVGVDINPGKDNPFVVFGDFHALVFPDGSADCVYTNALDHVFDFKRVVAEIDRVLKPGGHFVTDVGYGYGEGSFAGDYESIYWRSVRTFVSDLATMGGFHIVAMHDIKNGLQCVMRKQ